MSYAPDHTESMAEARRLMGSGQAQEAVACLQRLVGANDADAEALALLGVAVAMNGDAATGAHHIEAAIRLAPQQATYHFNLGCVREQAGDAKSAGAAYEQALKLHPGYDRAAEGYRRITGSSAGTGGFTAAAPWSGMPPTGAPVRLGADPILAPPTGPRASRTSPSSFGMDAPAGPGSYGAYGSPQSTGPRTIRDAPQVVRSIRWLYGLAIFLGAIWALMAAVGAPVEGSSEVPASFVFLLGFVTLGLNGWLMWAVPKGSQAAYYVQMVLSALGLLGFPLGTILHGYILYAWTRPETKAWFGVG
jgi:tetratricopeptide (TPR) repeat protein